MALLNSHELPTNLEAGLAQARRVVKMGKAQAELGADSEALGLSLTGDRTTDEWIELQRLVQAGDERERVAEAAQQVALNELVPPIGLVFAIWSKQREFIQGAHRAEDAWLPLPVALRVDDGVYPDGFYTKDKSSMRHTAVTAATIRNDLADAHTPGVVYAYSQDGTARYDITDPDYTVDLLPIPSEGKTLARSPADAHWSETTFV